MASYFYRTSNRGNKPCVAVPNDVFSRLCTVKKDIDNGKYSDVKSAGFDVIGAFTLYFALLIRMDYNRYAEYQISRLAERYFGKARSETYILINRYLLMLKVANLIDYDGGKYTGKNILCVHVLPVEKPYSLIACVNEKLIGYYDTERASIAFALHCLLNTKKVSRDKWGHVVITQDVLVDNLAVVKETIRTAIDLLVADGYLSRSTPKYYTTKDGKTRADTLTYIPHDFDEPVDNEKTINGLESQKMARQNRKANIHELTEVIKDFEQTPILLMGDYVKALDELCQKDPEICKKFVYRQTIDTMTEAKEFTLKYDKMELSKGMFLPIDLSGYRGYSLDVFLKFIENNNQLPIVILMERDNITAPLLSRMRYYLKKSTVNVRGFNFEPLHKGYQSYKKYYSFSDMLDHAVENCPELLIPTITNKNGNTAVMRIDTLISQLTGGKTHLDVLRSIPDPANDVATETKYLSLLLKRTDLSGLSICEYDTAIQDNGRMCNEAT